MARPRRTTTPIVMIGGGPAVCGVSAQHSIAKVLVQVWHLSGVSCVSLGPKAGSKLSFTVNDGAALTREQSR